MQIDDYETLLMEAVAQLEDNLMDLEMHLQDALFESTNKFRDRVSSLNSAMKNKTMDFIKSVVEHSDQFHTTLKNLALIEQAAFEAECADENFEAPDENDVEFNAKLIIFEDKEELVAMLDAFKDYME